MAAEQADDELQHYAEVPAHKDPNRAADDFRYLNKTLRACFVCRLVKSEAQFREDGCDNCTFLGIEEDVERLQSCTTPNFTGMISMMDPKTSWACKWTHISKGVPGCYALSLNEEMPSRLQETLASTGQRVPRTY